MTDDPRISGREPRLSSSYAQRGKRLLPLGRLANMLEVLPPGAVSLDVAEAALHNDAFYVRYAAARFLNKRGDRAARLVMQKVLNEGNVPSRASVARYLYGFSWFAIEPLIKQALADADARVREGAIYALCDARELSAFQLMTRVLQNEVDSVREAATWGLRECQDPACIPALEAALLAKDADVRIKALEVMGTAGLPDAMPAIRRAVHDPDYHVQYAATLSMLEIAGDSCLSDLAEIIRNSRGQTRAAVLRGFFHATNYLKILIEGSPVAEDLINALEMAIGDHSAETRLAAIWPLSWITQQRTADILVKAYLRETDRDLRVQFVRIPASLGSSAVDGILEHAINSEDEAVRSMAEHVIKMS